MAVKPLNAIGGFSVGETLIGVISPNGNVTAANLTVTGNSNLGLISNVTITGGTSGDVLSTDGAGNLSWIAAGGSSSALTVSQYTTGSYSNTVPNVSNLLFDTTTGFNVQDLGSGNVLVSLGSTFKTWEVNGQSSLVAVGEDTVEFVAGNGIIITTNALSTPQQIEFAVDFGNLAVNTANTVLNNAQPNITSVGTLTSISVSGNSQFTGPNVSLGSISNLHITGGSSGQILTTDGSGHLSWTTGSGSSSSSILLPIATVDDFTGDGVETAFGLSIAPSNINLTTVNYNGATLLRNTYTIDGSTITFSAPPANGSLIEVTTLTNGSTMANGNSSISIPAVDSDVTISVAGNTILDVVATGANLTGDFNATGNIAANYFIGNGSLLTGISASNISGNVANATHALTANTVTNNAQPNITSVGSLSSLSVTGNANIGNIGTVGLVIATGNIQTSSKVITNDIIGRTSGVTITAAGLNQNVTLVPTGNGYISASTYNISNVATPQANTDAATKKYVDDLVATGLSYHQPVVVATTESLATATGGTITYNNGTAGVGATLVTTGEFLEIDGANIQTVGTRILVKDEANSTYNGVYVYVDSVTIVRSDDTNTYGPGSADDLSLNDYFFVTGGVVNEGVSFVCSTAGEILFGVTDITFTIFGTSQVYNAGTGLTLSNTTFSIGNTAVTAGSYGNSDRIPSFTVNHQGQLTAVANIALTPNAANLTGTTLASSIVTSNLTSVGTLGNLRVTGTANVADLNASGNITTLGNITVTGKVVANYFVGTLERGNSNVNIANISGDVTVTAGNSAKTWTFGTNGNLYTPESGKIVSGSPFYGIGMYDTSNNSYVAVDAASAYLVGNSLIRLQIGSGEQYDFSSTGLSLQGNITTDGNVAANYFIGNGSQLTGIDATSIQNGNSNVKTYANGNVTTSVAGNANILIVTGVGANVNGTFAATGNISAPFFIGNGSQLTGIDATSIQNGNSNVKTYANGNVTTSVNGTSNVFVVTDIGANVTGVFDATGNISAPFFIGNGSQLTGIDATSIQNGNSNVKVYANGNVTTSVNGVSNVVVITDTGANVNGKLDVTGNVNLAGSNISLGDVSNLHITGGSANYALRTDGAGNLVWATAGTALVMTTDAFIADGSNASFTLTAAPLTKFYTIVSLGGLFQPASTYSLDGNVVTFSSVPPATAPVEVVTFGGGTAPMATTYVYAEISANAAAELNTKYIVNTDTTAITITLPNNPILGSEIGILDGTGNASVHNITLARNGNKIQGVASDMTVSTNRAAFTLVYYNASQGWILTNI